MKIRDTPEIYSLNPDPLLSIKDAASCLNISVSKIYDIA
jgi:hypothetical protein